MATRSEELPHRVSACPNARATNDERAQCYALRAMAKRQLHAMGSTLPDDDQPFDIARARDEPDTLAY